MEPYRLESLVERLSERELAYLLKRAELETMRRAVRRGRPVCHKALGRASALAGLARTRATEE